MRSITSFDLQYAHRFLNFQGEAQYLHGHTGVLTIEVEDTIEPGVNMVFPCNEIRKTAWEVLKNFDHALILREDDPLLPAILAVYDAQGIRNGAPSNRMKGAPVKTDLITCYPDCRLVVTKETLTTEGMIKIAYDLLKDKLNIAKITFTSGVNAASQEYKPQGTVDRCPLCGIALDENGVCPKCGYYDGVQVIKKDDNLLTSSLSQGVKKSQQGFSQKENLLFLLQPVISNHAQQYTLLPKNFWRPRAFARKPF